MMGWQWHQLAIDSSLRYRRYINHLLTYLLIYKSFAPRSRQITMPVAHQSVFTAQMPFLAPNEQRQSTEGITTTQLTSN